jgi:uncharacterized membrane protein
MKICSASHLKPGSSALFILVKEGRPEQVCAEIETFGGKILQARLAHQDEKKVGAALAAAQK